MKVTLIPIAPITPADEVRLDLPQPDNNGPDQKDIDQLSDDGCPNYPSE